MSCKIHAETIERLMERNWPKELKKTKQRINIYQSLAKAHKPMTASEIYMDVNENISGKPYAFSTIYRVLQTFIEYGMVSKSIAITDENSMYDLCLKNHRHYAVCLSCHERFPLKTCLLGDLSQMLPLDLQDFEITSHQIELYGYCHNCQNKKLSEN